MGHTRLLLATIRTRFIIFSHSWQNYRKTDNGQQRREEIREKRRKKANDRIIPHYISFVCVRKLCVLYLEYIDIASKS